MQRPYGGKCFFGFTSVTVITKASSCCPHSLLHIDFSKDARGLNHFDLCLVFFCSDFALVCKGPAVMNAIRFTCCRIALVAAVQQMSSSSDAVSAVGLSPAPRRFNPFNLDLDYLHLFIFKCHRFSLGHRRVIECRPKLILSLHGRLFLNNPPHLWQASCKDLKCLWNRVAGRNKVLRC